MNRPVHFEVLAEDPEKMADFYADLFGWEVSTWPGSEQGYWLVRTGEEGTPGIDGAFMGQHFPQTVINTIQVDSLEEMMTRLQEAGGKVEDGPNEIPDVGIHAYCTDPEGKWFGMMEPVEEG